MTTPEELLAAGEPHAALEVLQSQVRERAGDPALRVFLFQLLCVLGFWPRALNQLQVCGEMDAATLPMVNIYRAAIKGELMRESVFAAKARPAFFGHGWANGAATPPAWADGLTQALQADAQGETERAARLRANALDAAPATPGSLNGTPFEWIADADTQLGPLLEVVINERYGWVPFSALKKVLIEAPTDLRDLVWVSARLTAMDGAEISALMPSRYAGSATQADGALQLARKTEWRAIGTDQYRGLGQRVLTSSTAEMGFLEAREILLQPSNDGAFAA